MSRFSGKAKMKIILSLFGLLLLNPSALCQNSSKSGDPFVCIFEPSATFPGGLDSLKLFIKKNLKQTRLCAEGKVYVKFVVNVDGSLSDVKTLRGISPECDANALDVFTKMPKWIPGKLENKPVKQSLVMPIIFGH